MQPPNTTSQPATLTREDFQSAYGVLNDIFGNINEQLRFAEAKNGALVTVNAAIVFGIATLLADHYADMSTVIQNWLISIGAGCSLGALISLVSFMPELRPRQKPARVLEDPSNIFFFGHIRAHSEVEYLRLVYAGLGLPVGQPLPAHLHLANQIGTNSKNAHKKFLFFAAAAGLTLLTLVLSSLLAAVLWVSGGA
jgi:hypothetical protein